jgi:hypothetical protein
MDPYDIARILVLLLNSGFIVLMYFILQKQIDDVVALLDHRKKL